MRILVGCPVYQRAWILDRWFDHLDIQGYDLDYTFALTLGTDDTLDVIERRTSKARIGFWPLDANHSEKRKWDVERYSLLSDMRNRLLEYVRFIQPDYYFSLDSDILLPPDAISRLIEAAESYDAVAPLVYLAPGNITNAFLGKKGQHFRRAPVYGAVQTVDVICAAKLMTPAIYKDERVYYYPHHLGEDLGWSYKAQMCGFKLGFDTRVATKHIMDPRQLDKVDKRIGW